MFRFQNIIRYTAFIVLSVSLTSCCKDYVVGPDKPTRTVIVYMAADNNLYNFAISNIIDMQTAMGNVNGKLIVYLDPQSSATPPTPRILEIQHSDKRIVSSPVVKEYSEQNSASPEVMEQVITDIVAMYPSDSYGLVLWSHGTGWMPKGSYAPLLRSPMFGIFGDHPLVKTFAQDGNNEMEITNLAKHLPVKFDFILFDVCLMGGIEVVYELRHNADYIVASAAEVLALGFPYNEIIPYFFEEKANLVGMAQSFMNYYNSLSGEYRSATISVTKTYELDSLARITRTLLRNREHIADTLHLNEIQKYDRLSKTVFFDFEDFMEQMCLDRDLSDFKEQLSKTVIYKGHTSKFLNVYDINRSCGLSCYIPLTGEPLNDAYSKFEWANVWK